VLDNVGWHNKRRTQLHHIQPFHLPPCSPDFNPIQRLWQHLKGNPMAGYLTNDGEALTPRLLQSLQGVFFDESKLVRSVRSLRSLNRK
jgi:transposase